MKIPTNSQEVAKRFPQVSPERQKALIDHLEALPDATKTVDEIIRQGGPEGEFVAALFNREVPGRADAPHNKKVGQTGRK